jgi:hypothetical protein
MQVKKATAGWRGFDVDRPLTPEEYKTFADLGYSFVARYLPRTLALVAGNLTSGEIQDALAAGLAILPVQHVSPDGWYPSMALGTQYGQYAAEYAASIGLPPGMHLWLDLEGVAPGVSSGDVFAYCHAWVAAVSLKGYLHGLYCGWRTGLTPGQLYDLPFDAYWKAYNYDDGVPRRGYSVVQTTQQEISGVVFDPDVIQADNFGDLPILLLP